MVLWRRCSHPRSGSQSTTRDLSERAATARVSPESFPGKAAQPQGQSGTVGTLGLLACAKPANPQPQWYLHWAFLSPHFHHFQESARKCPFSWPSAGGMSSYFVPALRCIRPGGNVHSAPFIPSRIQVRADSSGASMPRNASSHTQPIAATSSNTCAPNIASRLL